MSKTTEEIVSEAHENVRKDRKRLETFADAVEKMASDPALGGDPSATKAAVAEAISHLVDGLTRSNAQLVELAKLLVKRDLVRNPNEGMSDKEVDGLFDEIGDGFAHEEGEDN